MMLGTIALEGLEFFGFHGVPAGERETGNRYTVDVHVEVDVSRAAEHDELSGTVDYSELYRIIAEVMGQQAKLLEYLAGQMLRRLLQELPAIQKATVSVAKANPPVGGVSRHSKITLSQSRAEL